MRAVLQWWTNSTTNGNDPADKSSQIFFNSLLQFTLQQRQKQAIGCAVLSLCPLFSACFWVLMLESKISGMEADRDLFIALVDIAARSLGVALESDDSGAALHPEWVAPLQEFCQQPR